MAFDVRVLSSQRELRLRMAFQGEGRRGKTRLRMALVALVVVRRGGKFSSVRIGTLGMARGAEEFAGLVARITARRLMALHAFQRRMFSLERESAPHVGCAVKERRLVARRVVAGRAIGTFRA